MLTFPSLTHPDSPLPRDTLMRPTRRIQGPTGRRHQASNKWAKTGMQLRMVLCRLRISDPVGLSLPPPSPPTPLLLRTAGGTLRDCCQQQLSSQFPRQKVADLWRRDCPAMPCSAHMSQSVACVGGTCAQPINDGQLHARRMRVCTTHIQEHTMEDNCEYCLPFSEAAQDRMPSQVTQPS